MPSSQPHPVIERVEKICEEYNRRGSHYMGLDYADGKVALITLGQDDGTVHVHVRDDVPEFWDELLAEIQAAEADPDPYAALPWEVVDSMFYDGLRFRCSFWG